MGFLDGVKVIDATRLLPGGYATMLLSDMGAEVVKVEQPGLGDYMRATPPTRNGVSPVHEMVNRNKLSVGVDLKSSEGKEVLRRLIRRSDVFVEGFRPGAMKRLGFSYEEVRKVNPRIVYCSISAFGQASRLSSMPGHDINFQSMAGTLVYPRRTEVPLLQLSDMVSAMYAAVAILGALCGKTAKAVRIDVPIVQSLLSWMILPVSAYLVSGETPSEGHSLIFGSTPYYNIYRTADGKYFAVAAIEEEFWHNLVVALGVPGLEHKRFGSAAERREVRAGLQGAFAKKTRNEWAKILTERDTCATPVLSVDEALNSEWAKAASMLVDVSGGGQVLNSPVKTSPPSRGRRFAAAPTLGRDTAAVLKSLGYSRAEVEGMRSKGIIE